MGRTQIQKMNASNTSSPKAKSNPSHQPSPLTKIVEIDTEYPYCALPEHFFERGLSRDPNEQQSSVGLVVEGWGRTRS